MMEDKIKDIKLKMKNESSIGDYEKYDSLTKYGVKKALLIFEEN